MKDRQPPEETPTQTRMTGLGFKPRSSFGGVLSPQSGKHWKSNPKTSRPVAVKQAMHVVLRSELAHGPYSLLLHDRDIQRIIRRLGVRFGVKIYDVVNAGRHLHIILRLPHRQALTPFLKSASGLIARLVLGAERGKPWLTRQTRTLPSSGQSPRKTIRFWDSRPWTSIVKFGPEFRTLQAYIARNRADLAALEQAEHKAKIKELKRLESSSALRRLPAFGFG